MLVERLVGRTISRDKNALSTRSNFEYKKKKVRIVIDENEKVIIPFEIWREATNKYHWPTKFLGFEVKHC